MAKKKKKSKARVPRCPGCKKEISWDTVEAVESDMSVFMKEKMYFCPKCGVVLGISGWHQIR